MFNLKSSFNAIQELKRRQKMGLEKESKLQKTFSEIVCEKAFETEMSEKLQQFTKDLMRKYGIGEIHQH